MDYFGGYQVQLLVSFVVIVGAAFVALVCDYLKGNNEQLRELAVELKVRQEQRVPLPAMRMSVAQSVNSISANAKAQRHAERAAAEKIAAEESLKQAVAKVAEEQAAPRPVAIAQPRRDSRVVRDAEVAMDRGNDIVAVRPRKTKIATAPAEQPAAATADIRTQRKAAMLARRDRAAQAPVEAAAAPAAETATQQAEAVPMPELSEPQFETAEPKLSADQKNLLDEILAATVAGTPALHREKGRSRSTVRDDLFSSIKSRVSRLESRHGGAASSSGVEFSEPDFVIDPSPAERLQRAIEATQNQTVVPAPRVRQPGELPAGLQDGFVLSKLIQTRKPVSGLVVSIGVGSTDRKSGQIPESVSGLIRSLLGADDFGCQSSEEEFLLIFPNERGASAQRKLNSIAERLWDFQLRSMGSFSILFSWGGVEVDGESISEAISSASERMHETQRSRKVASIGVKQPAYVTEPAPQRVAV